MRVYIYIKCALESVDRLLTLTFLDDLDDVVALQLFEAFDHDINGQIRIPRRNDPVGDQRQTRIRIIVETLYLVSLVAYNSNDGRRLHHWLIPARHKSSIIIIVKSVFMICG